MSDIQTELPFPAFRKIPRLDRGVVVTEKIDGTNSSVHIFEDGRVLFGSRNRWITSQSDNYGFATWASEHIDELRTLGVGAHYGEWWGRGIQRNYGLTDRRFSLFNTGRFRRCDDPADDSKMELPACVGLVPVLWTGMFCQFDPGSTIGHLQYGGSLAAPGFMRPEGYVLYHIASGQYFKQTVEKDNEPKGGGR